MKTIKFISKHLTKLDSDVSGKCAICGEEHIGFKLKKVLSANFNDWKYIKDGSTKHVCVDCQSCLGSKNFDGKALRNYSVIITKKEIKKIKRSDILEVIRNPLKEFVIIVNFSQKKHAFWDAKINNNKRHTYIATDKGSYILNNKNFLELYNDLFTLYEMKISKTEMRSGKYNFINLMKNNNIFDIDNKIKKQRGTNNFDFAIWLLHKEEK